MNLKEAISTFLSHTGIRATPTGPEPPEALMLNAAKQLDPAQNQESLHDLFIRCAESLKAEWVTRVRLQYLIDNQFTVGHLEHKGEPRYAVFAFDHPEWRPVNGLKTFDTPEAAIDDAMATGKAGKQNES